MNKCLILTPGYPSENDKYNNGFVHSRALNYQKNNMTFDVFSYNNLGVNEKYIYEGISVERGGLIQLKEKIENENYDKILIHFAFKKQTDFILKNFPNINIIAWVHGVEALGWYRRLFYLNSMKFYKFLGYIAVNTRQMLFMRKLILKHSDRVHFVFVSEWMKNILEKDTFCNNKITNYSIIPNSIDTNLFNFLEKDSNQRFNVLSIRPYDSKKYANDISVKVVLELSKLPIFEKFQFSFYGDGKLFNETLNPIKKFTNVKIEKRFLNHTEISKLHKENGIMLIPTRQDAQGVSMCEAMSSGLVPITSNNTAIPEYTNSDCAFVKNNYIEMAASLVEMADKPEKFVEMSENASKFIVEKCSSNVVTEKEIELIKK